MITSCLRVFVVAAISGMEHEKMCGILAVLNSPEKAEAVVTEPSITCSSAIALEWESLWADTADPSGRAIGTHRCASHSQ